MKSIVKKIRRKISLKLDVIFLKLGAKTPFFASLYYFAINPAFRREHFAVLNGKVKHLREIKDGNGNLFLLTRNIHRLEKGLLMRPRRPVFAKDYISETLDSFRTVWSQPFDADSLQLKWYKDVLEEYFASCAKSDAFIESQYQRFIDIISDHKKFSIDTKIIPYTRKEVSKITYDELLALSIQRRSVRWFLDKDVPRDLLDKAIAIAKLSPSACNRQPFEFRVIDDPSLVSKVVEYPMGTKGYSHSIKVLIVVVGKLDAYFDERDRHVIYIDASLASMSLMLGLETLGLGSCAINWPDIEAREKKMEQFLSLNSFERPIMCIGIGYPDNTGLIASSEKKPLNLIRRYNYE